MSSPSVCPSNAIPGTQGSSVGKRTRHNVDRYQTGQSFSKKTKKCNPENQIPKIAHIIWLNKQHSGSVPNDRFENIISLSKQFSAQGWNVKIWTNNPAIFYRAYEQTGLSKQGDYRGLSLEIHFPPLSSGNGKIQAGHIDICPDKELFTDLNEVGENYYTARPKSFNLPDLQAPPARTFISDDMESEDKVMDGAPYKKTLLDYYLAQQVGSYNFAAASDYLRIAALKKYGGVYIDSDTQGASFNDKYGQHYPAPCAPKGILIPQGWDSGYGSDIIAAKPAAAQLEFVSLDQFYQASTLNQLPYTLHKRGPYGYWLRRAVRYTSNGFCCTSGNWRELDCARGNKNFVSLADVARYPGYFYQNLPNTAPALQKGADLENEYFEVNEKGKPLRSSLTVYSPGPQTLFRMATNLHLHNYEEIMFKNCSQEEAEEQKQFDSKTTLSVTQWGTLSRISSKSWEQPEQLVKHNNYDDQEF